MLYTFFKVQDLFLCIVVLYVLFLELLYIFHFQCLMLYHQIKLELNLKIQLGRTSKKQILKCLQEKYFQEKHQGSLSKLLEAINCELPN